MAEDPQDSAGDSEQDQPLNARVSRLETGVDSLSGKIDQILGIINGGQGDGGHAGQPTGGGNVADEIRAQLDERDARARADAEKKQAGSELEALKTRVAELSEKPPEPMPRKVERFMGWR